MTTVEFRKTVSHIPSHRVLSPLDWALEWKAGTLAPVDFAFSFSSWEHDGLGRYGDPLDPWGDVKAFERASCSVKPGALMAVSWACMRCMSYMCVVQAMGLQLAALHVVHGWQAAQLTWRLCM